MVTINRNDRFALEERLQLLEARNELLLAAVAAGEIGIWEWNPETGCFLAHPLLLAMLGYDASKLVFGPQEWLARVHPDDRPRIVAALARLQRNRVGEMRESHRMIHRSGRACPVLSRAMIVERKDGRATRVIGVIIDLSGTESG